MLLSAIQNHYATIHICPDTSLSYLDVLLDSFVPLPMKLIPIFWAESGSTQTMQIVYISLPLLIFVTDQGFNFLSFVCLDHIQWSELTLVSALRGNFWLAQGPYVVP